MPRLTLRKSYRIHDKAKGLTEPSGLAISSGSGRLWTVSDGDKRLFELKSNGKIRSVQKLSLKKSDLEGVTVLPGGRAAVVCEKRSQIAIFDRKTGKRVTAARIGDMLGAEDLPRALRKGKSGKNGLEGLTFNPTSATFFAISERAPRMLIEIAQDLARILAVRPLSTGFGPAKADISGLAWDPRRAAFWIVSDTRQAVYLFDPASGGVTRQALMRKGQRVDNAEGVAVCPDGRHLFVVTDDGEESRLLQYRIG